jgi:hypothetical protein
VSSSVLKGVIDRIGPITRCDGRIVMLVKLADQPAIHRIPESIFDDFDAIALSKIGDELEIELGTGRDVIAVRNTTSGMQSTLSELGFY